MKESKVAIIIPSYNQLELLKKCLQSLRKTIYESYKVYVIDDSGMGNIKKGLGRKFSQADIIVNRKNLGFSKSCNIGMKEALRDYNPDYLLLLNDDTEIVDSDWLNKIVSSANKGKKIGILGCRVVFPNGTIQWIKNDQSNSIRYVEEVIGACFMIKKEVIEEIGFLDEGFSPVYGEESDFCFRASKRGFKLVYVGTTKIIHHGSSSTKTIFNERVWFLKKRNAIRLEWLNHSFYNIIKHTIIHFGSAILSKNPFRKIIILAKAYCDNIKNLKEIKKKRFERQ